MKAQFVANLTKSVCDKRIDASDIFVNVAHWQPKIDMHG